MKLSNYLHLHLNSFVQLLELQGLISSKSITVSTYNKLTSIAPPKSGKIDVLVLSDTVNMGGAEGVYQIWSNGFIFQIAANKQ